MRKSFRSTGVLSTRATTPSNSQQASRRNQSTPDPTTEIAAPTRSAAMSPRSNRRKNSVPEFAGPKTTGSPPRRLRSGELGHRLIRNRPPPKNRNGAAGSISPRRPERRVITKAPIRKQGNKKRSKQRNGGRRGTEEGGERADTDHWARRLARRRRPIGERVVSSAPSSIPASRWLRWGAGRRGSQEPGQSDPAQRSRRRGRAAAAAETGLGTGLL